MIQSHSEKHPVRSVIGEAPMLRDSPFRNNVRGIRASRMIQGRSEKRPVRPLVVAGTLAGGCAHRSACWSVVEELDDGIEERVEGARWSEEACLAIGHERAATGSIGADGGNA